MMKGQIEFEHKVVVIYRGFFQYVLIKSPEIGHISIPIWYD